MAKHEVVIHENTSATKDVAPYLGSYVAKETVREEGFIADIAKKSGLSAIQAQAILDGSFEALEALEGEALVRIHTDIGTIAGVITGSFETADAAFDAEKNTIDLALYLDDGLKLALADATVTVVADENLTKLRVDNVMDLETPRPYNLVHGQKIFRVTGFNMELADAGAMVYFQDKNGATFPVVVDEIISKQAFKGHSETLLEGGDYKLYVKSRAGEAEGPLQTSFRRVKYLKVAPAVLPPTLTKLTSRDGDDYVIAGSAPTLHGTNLSDVTISVSHDYGTGEVTREIDADKVTTKTDTEITLTENWYTDAGLYDPVDFVITVTNAAGTATHTARWSS